MSGFGSLLRKELAELIREKRLPVFALLYCLVSGLVLFFLIQDANDPSSPAPPNALAIALPLFFINVLMLVLLAATFVLDSVGKERDANMLGILLTTPATPSALLASKFATAMLGYALAMVLGIAFAGITSLALGGIIFQAMLLAFIGPLLVLYVFLVGTGLLLSVLSTSGRMAIGTGVGVYFPLFLVGGTPIFSALLGASPVVQAFIAWTPFAAASEGMNALLAGAATPWQHYIGTLALGAACLAAAFVLFQRQEVARS